MTSVAEICGTRKVVLSHLMRCSMFAVHMVRMRKMGVGDIAASLMRSDRWVHTWLERFDAGGLDGLRDLPRSGRPPKIPHGIMAQIIRQTVQPKCTPRELQKTIREETGIRLYITNVRKAMRQHGTTPKVPQKVHISRASKEAVRSWQYRFDRRVSRLEQDGFTIVDEDEVFSIHDVMSGRKYRFPRGEQIVVPYTRSHSRIVVYGAIAKDGRQLFRTYDRFRRAYLCRVSQGDAEAFWKGSGGSGQDLPPSGKTGQEATAEKQEHQDHIPSKRVAVPQCGRGMRAPGKTSPARLRILQDVCRHA